VRSAERGAFESNAPAKPRRVPTLARSGNAVRGEHVPYRRCYRPMRALLVHNPAAGTKGHNKDSIVAALQLADYKVAYVSTKDDDPSGWVL
jgi:hypothetical protein